MDSPSDSLEGGPTTSTLNSESGSTDPATRKRIAKVHKKNTRGETSLHVAARRGDTEICAQLLRDATERDWVNTPDYAGWTALHEACYQSRYETAEMLINNGANVNQASNEELTTPLHDAAQAGDNAIVWLLLKYGADRNVRDSKGQRPIDLCETDSVIAKLLTNAELPKECPSESSSPRKISFDNDTLDRHYENSNHQEGAGGLGARQNLPPLGILTCTEDATSFHSPGVGELLSTASFVVPESLNSIVNANLPLPHMSETSVEPPKLVIPKSNPLEEVSKLDDSRYRIESDSQQPMDFDEDDDENRLLIEENDEDMEIQAAQTKDVNEEKTFDQQCTSAAIDQDQSEVSSQILNVNNQDDDGGRLVEGESPESMDVDDSVLERKTTSSRLGRPKSSRTSTPVPTPPFKELMDRKKGGRGRKRGGRGGVGRGGSCASSPQPSRFGEGDIYEFKDSPESGDEQSQEVPDRETSAPPSWKKMRLDEEASRSGESNDSRGSPSHHSSSGQQVPILRISLNKGGSDDEGGMDDSQSMASTSSRGGKNSSLRGNLKNGSSKKQAPLTREGTPAAGGQTDDDGQSRMTRSRIRQSGKTIEEPDYWGKGKKMKRMLPEGEVGDKEGDEVNEEILEPEEDPSIHEEDYAESLPYDIDRIALKETNIGQRIMLYDSTRSRLEMQKHLVFRWIEDATLDSISAEAAESLMPPNYSQYMIATREYLIDTDWFRTMSKKEPLLTTLPQSLQAFWDSQQKIREKTLRKMCIELARQQMVFEREYLRHYRRSMCGPNRVNVCRMLRELESYNSMTLLQPGHPEDEPVMSKEDFVKSTIAPINDLWKRHMIESAALASSQRSLFSIEMKSHGLMVDPDVLAKLCPEIPTRRLEMFL